MDLDIASRKLKSLQMTLSMVEEMSEKEKRKIEQLVEDPGKGSIGSSNLHIDPCVMSRIDEIDIQLAKLRSMRKQEETKRNTDSKSNAQFQDQLSEINDNLEQMVEIQNQLSKSFDECAEFDQIYSDSNKNDQLEE